MLDYMTHYYRRGTPPFRSLMTLPVAQAIEIMHGLYVAGSPLVSRFEEPVQYLHDRRKTERWVRQSLAARGHHVSQVHAIYMVLGDSAWIRRYANTQTAAIRVDLALFREGDVSFTYPDSMASLWLSRNRPPEYYRPEYHGRVFTLTEIRGIVEAHGLPEEWDVVLPESVGPYIEAQVWNPSPLLNIAQQTLVWRE